MLKYIEVVTQKRTHFEDITDAVQEVIDESGIDEGICCVYVPHTTAGVFINENADPDVKWDIEKHLINSYHGKTSTATWKEMQLPI